MTAFGSLLARTPRPSRSPTRRGSAPPSGDDLASCSRSRWAPTTGPATRSSARVDATAIDAAAIGREAAERATREREPGRRRARRLPGRAPPVRRRRPPRHARLPRLLGARGPGGPLVLRARQARRLAAGLDRRRRRATRPGCRWASTPRASPSSASSLLDAGRLLRPRRTTPRPPPAPGAARPATASPRRTRTARSRPTWSWRRATRRSTSWSAGSTAGLLVTRFHYTNPVHGKKRDHHRHDARRDVPRRGRRGRRARSATSGSRCPTSMRWPASRRSAASGGASAASSAGAWCRRCGSPRSRSPASTAAG